MASNPEQDPETGPFRLDRPARQTVPFVFASPHSGRRYPASLLEHSRLDATTLRRSEDAFVDELFANAVNLGAPLLCAVVAGEWRAGRMKHTGTAVARPDAGGACRERCSKP